METGNRNMDEIENRIRQAESGDAKAQYELAESYEKGISCRRNIPKAMY